MRLRITTLSENTATLGDLLAEWGLSVLVETDDTSLLLDTGRSISASYNATILGIDLERVDRIVLSHGHVDHTGGLRQVLRQMRKEVEVVAHPDIWADRCARRQGGKIEYCGVPYQRRELESLGARFRLTSAPVALSDRILTSGEMPMVTDFEALDSHLLVKAGGSLEPDRVLDDLALVINTEGGLVVITGCAHRGIINTLRHAQRLTGVDRILALVGGCHLFTASEERLWQTIAAVKEMEVSRIGVSHCTGLPAAAIMAQELGDRFFFNNAGTTIDLSEEPS